MFPLINDQGEVMSTCSTRKKAFAKAKRLVYRGLTRYAEVRYRYHGRDLVRKYGDRKEE